MMMMMPLPVSSSSSSSFFVFLFVTMTTSKAKKNNQKKNKQVVYNPLLYQLSYRTRGIQEDEFVVVSFLIRYRATKDRTLHRE